LPRVVFASVDQFKAWMKKKVTPERYEAYITKNDEVILVPKRSTPPVLYGYYEANDEEALNSVKSLLEEAGLTVFNIQSFEWKSDWPPGVSFVPATES